MRKIATIPQEYISKKPFLTSELSAWGWCNQMFMSNICLSLYQYNTIYSPGSGKQYLRHNET